MNDDASRTLLAMILVHVPAHGDLMVYCMYEGLEGGRGRRVERVGNGCTLALIATHGSRRHCCFFDCFECMHFSKGV